MLAIFKGRCKPFAKPAALGAAMLALVACQPVATGSGPSINTRNAVPVALLVPGGSANAADDLAATSLQNAARLAI